ncbi:alkyl hydroperoxide reductase/ thiol specific antioxidant/ Mal allergen, partial [Umbelopsis sp. PMI_123]
MTTHPLINQEAPSSITLKNQRGEDMDLDSLIGQGNPIVLFFYPRDEGPVCTKEVCAFRDSYSVFLKHGAIVIGVSGNPVDSHLSFANRHRLQFDILADTEGRLRKMYQVPRGGLGFVPGRATFVIDGRGQVRSYHNSLLNHRGHVENAILILDALNEEDY